MHKHSHTIYPMCRKHGFLSNYHRCMVETHPVWHKHHTINQLKMSNNYTVSTGIRICIQFTIYTVNSYFFFLRVQMKNCRLRSVILYVSSYEYVYQGFLACIHFRNVRNRLQMHSDPLTFLRRTLGTSSEVSVWKMHLSNLEEDSK